MMGRKDLEQMLRNGFRRCSNVGIGSSWSKQTPSAPPRSGVQNFKAAGVNGNVQNGTAAAAAESSEPSVIVIDDEESEVESADISSEDGESSSSRSTSYSNEEEEDDLQFLGSRNRVYCTRTTTGAGDGDAEAAQSDTGSCGDSEGSSGCEVVGSSQQWKEAALRKQGIKRGSGEAEQDKRKVCVEPKVEPGEHAAKKPKTPASVEDDSFRGTSEAKQGAGNFSQAQHGEDTLTLDREKLRQTAEYKEADQQEWASRQLELQKQALEVQKLKKRKKAEAERKLEMESRQKQRLLEMRESQKKEERNMGLKDQIRGKVQAELERVASECFDLASLLQRLGINLGGGSPSIQQVNAGYKKALLKFHPDRASGSGDIRRQVEAEEKFKLISRMKNVLKPVAT